MLKSKVGEVTLEHGDTQVELQSLRQHADSREAELRRLRQDAVAKMELLQNQENKILELRASLSQMEEGLEEKTRHATELESFLQRAICENER